MADDGVSIEITGLSELKATLETLKTSVADRCIRKALRAGAVIEKDAIETLAPIRPDLPSGTALPPGALANDVTITVKRVDADNTVATVGPGRLTKHAARWTEYGHRMVVGGRSKLLPNGKTKGPGKEVGMVPPHPYIRVAFEGSVQQVTDAIAATLAEEITKAAANPKNLA
jgi:HK97 gp10 family phage protein